MKHPLIPLALVMSLQTVGWTAEAAKVDTSKIPPVATHTVDFEKEVYPIFKESCFSCHGPEKQKGRYRMDTKEGAFKKSEDYGPAIAPGKSLESSIILMACGLIDEMQMPPPSDKPGESEPLSDEQIGILRAWIDQGAKWPDGPIKEYVKPVGFAADIQPVLQAACAECHGGSKIEGGFSVDSLASVLKGGEFYGKIITAGDVKKSPLMIIIAGKDTDLPAPEKHRLPAKQIELVGKWIEQGAKP
jgi:mono/diheme cytochrome c family protein